MGLGTRFTLIGRAETTLTGEPSASADYPLLLVEADPIGSEMIDPSRHTGVDKFTVAVQVLTLRQSPTAAELEAMLIETNEWTDSLTEQLRHERPGQLVGVNKLPLP